MMIHSIFNLRLDEIGEKKVSSSSGLGYSKFGYHNSGLVRNLKFLNMIIGYFKKNRENCPKRAFEQRNKEICIKIWPWASANWPLNNWALHYTLFPDL